MKYSVLKLTRLRIILYLCLISCVVTLARLVDVQLIKGREYQEMADANRTFSQVIPRERGLLLDRYGNTLVVNEAVYYHSLTPERLYSDRQLIDRNTALHLMATESAVVTTELRRNYLLGSAGAHILGYTGPVTADNLKADSDLKIIDIVGKQGLEKMFDTTMRGRAGTEVYEIDALGKKQKMLQVVAGTPGYPVQTTLDPYLTQVGYQAMGDKSGAVVIQDGSTGEVLALVSTPSFDPNMLTMRYGDEQKEKQRQQAVQEAFSHPKQLFFNRALSGTYPPGSVFKLVTAAAGLNTGSLDTATTVIDEGVLTVGEYSYANWYFTQYGSKEGEIGLQRAIARSNDIYFYKAAEWIGPSQLATIAREFGFGKRTGIELQSESEGIVPDPAWKEETFGERWFLGNTYHFGIGQGDLLVTPLQVSQMTQAIANRGSLCSPHIIQQKNSHCMGMSILDEHLETVVAGMIDACSSGGTAYPLFSWNAEHSREGLSPYEAVANGVAACKTGTAEFGASDAQGYKKTHGWFTLFVGTENILNSSEATESATVATESARLNTISTATESAQLKYQNHEKWKNLVKNKKFPAHLVITVLVESSEGQPFREGSRDAAPVAKAILDWMVEGKSPTQSTLNSVPVPSDALAE